MPNFDSEFKEKIEKAFTSNKIFTLFVKNNFFDERNKHGLLLPQWMKQGHENYLALKQISAVSLVVTTQSKSCK